MCRKKILETLILYRPSANQPFVTLPLCMSTVRHQQQQMMQPLKSTSPLSPCRIPVVWDILAGGRAASCYVLHCACTKLHNAQARAAQLYVARIWCSNTQHIGMCVETYKHPRRERNRTTYKYTVYLWVCACVCSSCLSACALKRSCRQHQHTTNTTSNITIAHVHNNCTHNSCIKCELLISIMMVVVVVAVVVVVGGGGVELCGRTCIMHHDFSQP